MANPYDDMDAVETMAAFSSIARDFDRGPRLSRAAFPEALIEAYSAFPVDDPVHFDNDDDAKSRIFFLAQFADGWEAVQFDSLNTPRDIHFECCVFSEPPTPHAELMARYAPIARVYGDVTGGSRLLVCLDTSSVDYGSLVMCDMWSACDRRVGELSTPVAPGLVEFWAALTTKAEAEQRLAFFRDETDR